MHNDIGIRIYGWCILDYAMTDFEKARDEASKKTDIGLAETSLYPAFFCEGADWARDWLLPKHKETVQAVLDKHDELQAKADKLAKALEDVLESVKQDGITFPSAEKCLKEFRGEE